MNVDSNSIISSINLRMFLKDSAGVYQWVNEQFADSTGLPISSVIGRTDYDLVWSAQADYFREDDKRALAGVPLVNVERSQTRKNGLTKIILNLSPYRPESGEIVGVVGSFFDCTDHFVIQTRGAFSDNKFHLGFVNDWLSASELRVLFWHFSGFATERISEKMGISLSTVRYHIENIKVKMGCSHKNEIQRVAIKHGIFWKIFSLQHVIDDSLQNANDI